MDRSKKVGTTYSNVNYETLLQRLASLETTVVYLDSSITDSKHTRGSDFEEVKRASSEQLKSINKLELSIMTALGNQKLEFSKILDAHDDKLKGFIEKHYVSKTSLQSDINRLMFKFCMWLTGIFGTALTIAYFILRV